MESGADECILLGEYEQPSRISEPARSAKHWLMKRLMVCELVLRPSSVPVAPALG